MIFLSRHIGSRANCVIKMYKQLETTSQHLINKFIPNNTISLFNNTFLISVNDSFMKIRNTQGFGLPLLNGSPRSAFYTTNNNILQKIPSGIIDNSIDGNCDTLYRIILPVKEQHIKKDNTFRNIHTSLSLLTNMSSVLLIYHGKKDLIDICTNINKKTLYLNRELTQLGYMTNQYPIFDNVIIYLNLDERERIYNNLKEEGVDVRLINKGINISINETTSILILNIILGVFDETYLVSKIHKQNVQ
jgi:glycine cleavage system pyridoxal-binding protein P